jgi:hypothetical protein
LGSGSSGGVCSYQAGHRSGGAGLQEAAAGKLEVLHTKIPFSLQRVPNMVRGLAAAPRPALRAIHSCSLGTVLLYSAGPRGETMSAQSFGKK